MALLTWRKRDTEGAEQGPIKYLSFDATLLEEFSRAANVTQFPVENGSVVSDHYQPQPRAITLDVQVTDTPAAVRQLIDGMQSEVNEPLGFVSEKALDLPVNKAPVTTVLGTRVVTANASRFPKKRTASVLQFDGEVYRTVDVFLALDELMTSRQLVNVLLFKEVEYQNMVITNIRTPRDAQSGSTLTFSIDLLQIEFASTEVGDAPAPAAAKHKRKKDAGNKNPTAPSPVERARETVDNLDYEEQS